MFQDCTQERKIISLAILILDFNIEMQELEEGKTNKLLRTEESEGIKHPQMRETLKKE